MTKKDFIELAEQFAIVKRELDAKYDHVTATNATVQDETSYELQRAMWARCAYGVMLACRATNANFDRSKFLTACGVANIGVK